MSGLKGRAASRFAVGIDGGGSGTRVVLADSAGRVLGRASGGPSALGLGVGSAWRAIETAVSDVFAAAGHGLNWEACTVCCGLSGVNNTEWRQAFERAFPAGATLILVSDAYTTLWGAHGGHPGIVVALGTGSIAAALDVQLVQRVAGGYGFPSGDEASGAWLGLRAIVYLQQVMDGRRPADGFSASLRAHTAVATRDELVSWSCDADQTAYAALAPIVIAHATGATGTADVGVPHPYARALLDQAGDEIARMIDALDPAGQLPVALCGGLAEPLRPFVPERFATRLRAPSGDSVNGALAIALANVASAARFA